MTSSSTLNSLAPVSRGAWCRRWTGTAHAMALLKGGSAHETLRHPAGCCAVAFDNHGTVANADADKGQASLRSECTQASRAIPACARWLATLPGSDTLRAGREDSQLRQRL